MILQLTCIYKLMVIVFKVDKCQVEEIIARTGSGDESTVNWEGDGWGFWGYGLG